MRKVTSQFVKEGDPTDMLVDQPKEKVTVRKFDDCYVRVSYVDNYIFRL